MSIDVTGAYIYYTIPVLGGIPITQTMVSLVLVTLTLCLGSVYLGRDIQKRPGGAQTIVEKLVGMLENLVVESMGEHNRHWTPFIGTIFMSSILGSLIGMTGFFRSTTADLSVPLTWAVMVSVIIWYNSIKRNGLLGWLKGFTEPIVVMTPMNIVSEIAQPVSMAFRHFGNVAGGGVITTAIYTALSLASAMVLKLVASSGVVVCCITAAVGIALCIWKRGKIGPMIGGAFLILIGLFSLLQCLDILTGVPILSVGIPAVLSLYFDLFSGFIQAFVFCLLTMVYIGNACPPYEADEA